MTDKHNHSRRNFLRSAGALATVAGFSRFGLMNAFAQSASNYKALVCVFLFGGNDSHNMLVPQSPAAFNAYKTIRGSLALPDGNAKLLPVSAVDGTPYALTGGLYSRSPENIRRVKREFRVGNLYINRKITGALVSRQPFGGFKLSGVGSKAGGPDYLLQFVVPRVITENTMRRGFAPERSSDGA